MIYLLGAFICRSTVGISLPALCILSSVTEFSILLFRLVVIVKNRRLLHGPAGEDKK